MPPPDTDTSVLRFGPFSLDPANARLLRDGEAMELVPKDLDVLCFLARRAGRLVSKDELLDAVWQRRFVSESVLKNAISRLRGLLGDDARAPRYIETAQRRGYRFIANVAMSVTGVEAPVPGALPALASLPGELVGREDAMHWLRQHLQTVLAGRSRLALLAGEAGIGKSSLIEAFVAPLRTDGRAWLATGQCVEHAGAVEPYLPVLEAISGLCKSYPEAGLVALMRQVAPTWLLQLPWFVTADDRQLLQHEVAGATRERMLREFAELLERITAARPLVMVIEDLHWCDGATLQLLGYLARRPGGARVLMLGSLRPAEVIASEHPLKALRQELRQQRLCDELELNLFSEQDAADYLARHAAGVEWSDALVRGLHEHTGGLPLFVAAVIDELAGKESTHDPASRAHHLQTGLRMLREVPRSIFGLIEQQHARLSETRQRRLEAAAVAGVEFVHAPLADALGVDADDLQADFDAFVRAGTWLRDGGATQLPDGQLGMRYVFRHAVYRHVLYDLAGASWRTQMHRRLALALQRAHATQTEAVAAELALHFEKGEDPVQAVRQLAIAAHRALRRFAAAQAASIAKQGLALLQSLPERPALRDLEIELNVELGLSMSILRGVTSDESTSAFSHAAELMDDLHPAPARIAALHGIWMAMLARAKYGRAKEMAAQALTLAAQRGDPHLAFAGHSAMGITLAHTGDSAQAQEHLGQALELRSAVGTVLPDAMFSFHPDVQLHCYSALMQWNLGQPSAAARQVEYATELANALRQPVTWILARFVKALFHCMLGEYEQARALTDRALEDTRELRLERGSGALWWVNGRAIAALGDTDAGLQRMRQGHQVKQRHGQGYGLTRWHEHFAEACMQAGRHDEAAATLDEGLQLADRNGEHLSSSSMQRLRGDLLSAAGQQDSADTAYRLARTIAREQGALYLEIGAAVGRCERGPPVGLSPAGPVNDLEVLLGRWSDPLSPPHVARARAWLADRPR